MTAPFLSVIVPAYNCAGMLARCLAALHASDLPRADWQLIIADDGSTDDTSRVAAEGGDLVVRIAGGPSGPGRARNEAALVATGEVLVFVDADVCVERTALSRFAALFRANAKLGSVFGAYDLAPDAPAFVSQYRNLLHHYVHSLNAGPASTFWAGCGAIRRSAFLAVHGFDIERYRRPQIEDIELGYRLTAAGWPIELHPEIQGKHLKRWTFKGGIITDFRDRGVPWMRLMLEGRTAGVVGALNLAAQEKLFTAIVPLALAALAVAPLLHGILRVIVIVDALLGLGLMLAGNLPMIRWFARVRGWPFALRVVPMRITYYALNACSAAWAIWLHLRAGRTSTSRDRGSLHSPPQASS